MASIYNEMQSFNKSVRKKWVGGAAMSLSVPSEGTWGSTWQRRTKWHANRHTALISSKWREARAQHAQTKAHLSGRSLPGEHKSSKRKCRLVVRTRGERWIGPKIDTTTTSNNGRLECRTNGVSRRPFLQS